MGFEPLSFRWDAAAATLYVAGSIDELNVAQLESEVATRSDAAATLRVDVTDVNFLPSQAIAVLALAHQRAVEHDRTLLLQAGQGSLARRLLELSGLPLEG